METKHKLVISGISIIATLVILLFFFKIVTIEGNQLGVMESWKDGVRNEILLPKTYVLSWGFTKEIYKYDAASRIFVMNDGTSSTEKVAEGREQDAYLVQSQEGQDMKISLNLRWRINPEKLVHIHKTVRQDIEEKLIRPEIMRVVKDKATQKKAIEAYSGDGLVKLQLEIQNALSGKDNSGSNELLERGIVVENFVIENIVLEPKYIEEIKQKQIATQRTLRAAEEQKAAEAEALVAKAKAQADYNKMVVEAERDAKVMVTKAQAENEKVIIAAKAAAEQVTIAAEAEKQKMVLEGEGKKLSMVSIADGTLAQGKADAVSKELLLTAYNKAGTNAFIQIEIAKAVSEGFKNIQGYLPEKINITTLSRNFVDAVGNIMGRSVGDNQSVQTK